VAEDETSDRAGDAPVEGEGKFLKGTPGICGMFRVPAALRRRFSDENPCHLVPVAVQA